MVGFHVLALKMTGKIRSETAFACVRVRCEEG